MASFKSLPPEIIAAIASHLFLPELEDFAKSRLSLHHICQARLDKHKQLQAFASWDPHKSARTEWPKLPYWKTLLLQCLRDPDTIYYVKSLHGPDWQSDEHEWLTKTFYVQQEPYFSEQERGLIQKALDDSPWIRRDDEYGHFFTDSSNTVKYNSQLVPEWKTMDVLGILLPMLYNLESLHLVWHIEESAYMAREDYISLAQVLQRICYAVCSYEIANPWPKLKDLTVDSAPRELIGLIQCILDFSPVDRVYEPESPA